MGQRQWCIGWIANQARVEDDMERSQEREEPCEVFRWGLYSFHVE